MQANHCSAFPVLCERNPTATSQRRRKHHNFINCHGWRMSYNSLVYCKCICNIRFEIIQLFLATIALKIPSEVVLKLTRWIIITWLCDILALVWHFGPACVRFRPGLCDILALSCVTKASACHHTPISNTGAVYRKFHRSSVSKTT